MQMNLASDLVTDKTIKKSEILCDNQIDNINYLNLLVYPIKIYYNCLWQCWRSVVRGDDRMYLYISYTSQDLFSALETI